MISILAISALVAGLVGVMASAAGAATSCRANDGITSSSNLQTIIDGASSGDTIKVKGVCRGHFFIDKDLRLVGKATERVRQATLSGGLQFGSSVVATDFGVTVTFKDLLSTLGEAADEGAGISTADGSTVILNGSTKVNGNGIETTPHGGGIYNQGTLIMNDSSQVNGNEGDGGGIVNFDTLILNDSAQVNGNGGGGIFNIGGHGGYCHPERLCTG